MKHYGSAVLTALQAQYKSVEEVGELVRHRKLTAFINGGMPAEWLDEFWHTMALLEAQGIGVKERV